jgi:hypothetical protein
MVVFLERHIARSLSLGLPILGFKVEDVEEIILPSTCREPGKIRLGKVMMTARWLLHSPP